ncbi:MAG: LytR C-terminal domain-containing protein [Trebonia sp.]
MSDESAGRPGQPGKPHRFYFDDLADEEPQAPLMPAAERPTPAPPLMPPPGHPEPTDDDLVDTGPIQVIRDPVLGSAAGQQLFFDDLAPLQHASGPISPPPAAAPEDGEFADAFAEADVDDADPDVAERPTRGALALAAARRPRPVGAVLAVVAVLALIGVLAAVGGSGHGGTARDSAAVGTTTPTGQPSTVGTGSTTSSAGPPRSASSAPSIAPTRPIVPVKAPSGIELTVLNNTIHSGLAKSAAREFSTRGWQVGTVGNYTGQLSATTVYYDAGNAAQEQAARTLVAQFPGVAQVQPRPLGLPGSGLTVVLAPDWHA